MGSVRISCVSRLVKALYQLGPHEGDSNRMIAKEGKDKDLKKWLARERKHSEDLDKMLLEQSRRHRALEKRTKIARFVVNR